MYFKLNAFAALLVFILVPALTAQQLNVPLNIKQAYDKGTRSTDGKPGSSYWQNSADYIIEAEVDPAAGTITGVERIVYYNNSPDTLDYLIIRNYLDFFKKGSARNYSVVPEAINEGVNITELKIDSVPADMEKVNSRTGTNFKLQLPIPLAPSASVELNIKWNLIIPSKANIRMGTYDSTSFMIAYWYPQIAVYDDIDGWDTWAYNGEQEFYNDFNNYDVKITVPDNYALWATGTLQNPSELLQPEYLKRFEKAHESDSVVNIIKQEDLHKGNLYTKNTAGNTWHYKAEYVPDFAFALSDHYLWDAVSYTTPGGRDVFMSAVYNEESKDFYDVAKYSRMSIKYFSEELPKVDFPYPSMTIFNGSGGMEFPMMVNNGSASTHAGTVHLVSHEIAHTYFPFYMGINEKKYAWMDEGWATMLPFDFQERTSEGYNPRNRNAVQIEEYAGKETDMPVYTLTTFVTGQHYRQIAYRKSGMAYDILMDMLGTETFTKALQTYIERWHGKHPVPFDFFYTFNDAAGKDLNWFWKSTFMEKNYADLSIKKAEFSGGEVSVEIENKGGQPVPVDVIIYSADGKEVKIHKTAEVWEKGSVLTIKENTGFTPISIELGTDKIPDADRKDNSFDFKQLN